MKINGIEFAIDPNVQVCAVRIGPEQAKVAIDNMVDNQRPRSIGKTREYAKMMSEGKWKVSNDAAIVCNGKWLNANHRLHAILESGKEQTILLLKTEDESILRVVDGGKLRRVADVLKMETGTIYASDIATISSLILAYSKGLLTSAGTNMGSSGAMRTIAVSKIITRQDRIAYAVRYRNPLLEAAQFAAHLYEVQGALVTKSLAGAVYYLIKEKDGETVANEYLTGLFTGEGMSASQKQLRLFLFRDVTGRKKTNSVTKFGIILKSYISHRNGTCPAQLMLKSSELFPKL
jgi:hypothetical protein